MKNFISASCSCDANANNLAVSLLGYNQNTIKACACPRSLCVVWSAATFLSCNAVGCNAVGCNIAMHVLSVLSSRGEHIHVGTEVVFLTRGKRGWVALSTFPGKQQLANLGTVLCSMRVISWGCACSIYSLCVCERAAAYVAQVSTCGPICNPCGNGPCGCGGPAPA